MAAARLTISDVHKRTGIPVTTLRFYEKELPEFFTIEKTRGGHRRYTEENIRQFLMVKRMVETEGVKLSQIREQFSSPKSKGGELRSHVDLLLSVYEAMTAEIDRLKTRIESLELSLAAVKKAAAAAAAQQSAKKRRWF
ncbi:MAG TPA: MerR family transcriptional regulator [Thermoanaerobaculia bacterium]